jgi:hypothetical protein
MCIQPDPQRIVWVFSEWQKAYDGLSRDIPQIEFVKNYQPQLYESFDSRVRNLVVLDDQMENRDVHKRSSDSIVKFFTQGSHHRNLTIVYIVQNLFNQDKSMRTVSLNAHYIVVFKNPRDGTQIQTLACQMFPGNPAPLLDAFRDATAPRSDEGRGYLLLDLHPTSCDALRLLTNVLDAQPTAYVPEQYIKEARGRHAETQSTDDVRPSAATLPRNVGAYDAAHTNNKHMFASQAKGKNGRRKTNRQIPRRMRQPGSLCGRAQRRFGRRDQVNMQRRTERRARRCAPDAGTTTSIQQVS